MAGRRTQRGGSSKHTSEGTASLQRTERQQFYGQIVTFCNYKLEQAKKLYSYITVSRKKAIEAVARIKERDHRFLFTGIRPSF